jgi:hypothetical protein
MVAEALDLSGLEPVEIDISAIGFDFAMNVAIWSGIERFRAELGGNT